MHLVRVPSAKCQAQGSASYPIFEILVHLAEPQIALMFLEKWLTNLPLIAILKKSKASGEWGEGGKAKLSSIG